MPEPDTRMAEDTGGGRSFAVTREALWHALWGGLHRTPRGPASASWQRVPSGSIYPPCVDAEGRVWQAGDDLFRVWDARGGMHAVRAPGLRGNWRCSASDDGSIWIPTNLGVFRLDAGDDAPRLVVRSIPGEDRGTPRGYRAFESPGGDLFVARGDRVCRAAVRQVEGDGRPEWTCQEVPGAGSWEGFAAMPSGDTWAALGGRGFFRHRGGRWEPIPGSARLASQWTSSITRNADGTAWLTGCGYAVRAAERPGEGDGWEIVEQPGAWQGVWKTRVADAIEDSDGGVWLSVDIGVLEVPAGVRRAAVPPPAVALAEASIDGRPLPVAEVLRLPHHRNRLELRFAAASYRDPSLLRYRSRLRPDEPWSPPTANPLFRFVDVAPGEYRVEVEATLDGVRWSPQPALFSFSVGRPWYLEPWVFLAALAAAAGAGYAVHRTRIAVLVRLERQRARIAMDLHDELGSGLGTIGILAGVAARPGVDAERRWALVERIGHVSRQLGDALTDMVRTLRPGAANTASLAAHLRERGEAMFPGPEPRLEVDLPDPVPVVPLSLAVRRNVALLGLEVLHNAATHAGARKVTLSLVPGRRFWTLSVSDDGRGLGEAGPPAPGHGSGLDGMRWRAEAIGARLEITADPSRGTRVRLEFEPDSVERDIPERGKRQRTAGRSRGSAG
jgi:signal transduction histidine kinase